MQNIPKTKDLILNFKNGWLNILFDNVQNKNALKDNLIEELLIIFDLIKNDKGVRGVLLRGNGDVFCAGADLKKMKEITDAGESAKNKAFDLSMRIGNLLNTINKAPQVVISVTEGYAFAGGFGIACASDFVISLPNTKFALTETKIGLTPSQISKYVVRKLGYSCAKKMMLLGTVINGSEGYDIGLVDYIISKKDNLEKTIETVKAQVLECSPDALAITKKVLSLDNDLDLEQAADLFSDTIISDDGREGFESFFQKRSPKWINEK